MLVINWGRKLADAKVTRIMIIDSLTDALEPLDWVYAFYEGGAIAFDRLDRWSDIDLYVVVKDDKIDETFVCVEKALKELSPLRLKYRVPQTGWPDVFQTFYKLTNANEYLLIDLAVLKLNTKEKFLEPEIHGMSVFYFNKGNIVKPESFDEEAFRGRMQDRLDRIRTRLELFGNFVQKEISRSNTIEAIGHYYALILSSLVEVLRMRYSMMHYDFGLRYVHHELPDEVVKKLENLYFVTDTKTLQTKYLLATQWLNQTIRELPRTKSGKARLER